MIEEYIQCIESSIHLPKLVWKIFFKMSLASKKANEENPKWLITIQLLFFIDLSSIYKN